MFTLSPRRALWIPAGVEHRVEVLQRAELHSLHLFDNVKSGDGQARVLEAGRLLEDLVVALVDEEPASQRYLALCSLALLEVSAAPASSPGAILPSERRLRAFCEAFLVEPRRDRAMSVLAREIGASVSTINRLFRSELGTSFLEWRQGILLAHSHTLAAQGLPITQIALELGYSSPSAFSFMVSQAVGMPPGRYLRRG